MVIRQHDDITQIAVLEDNVLVEHYVARESQTSLIGNVYLGRVQNVLPSHGGRVHRHRQGPQRRALRRRGQLVGRSATRTASPARSSRCCPRARRSWCRSPRTRSGTRAPASPARSAWPAASWSTCPTAPRAASRRKLPDTERNRLKNLLKEIVPDTAGVIVRTAAEGATEDELTRDVERLTARWEDIEKKAKGGRARSCCYGEPDLTLKVVRDLFTEDFAKLVIEGDDAWETVQ